MPQPVTLLHYSLSMNPAFVTLHKPDCVAAIGLVALSWTRVESEMMSMVSGALGRTSRNRSGGFNISPNRIAYAAMREAETIRVRIKIVDAVLGPMLEGNPLDDEWAALRDRLNKRGRDRNKVVHAEWGYSEDMPQGLVQKGKDDTASLWKKSDFDDVCERIAQLENDLNAFMRSVLNAIHDGTITKFVTPDMIVREV